MPYRIGPGYNSVDMEYVFDHIKRTTGMTSFDLTSPRKTRGLVRVRWLAMYLLHFYYDWTQEDIGIAFDKDHATVANGLKKFKAILAAGDRFAARMCFRVKMFGERLEAENES